MAHKTGRPTGRPPKPTRLRLLEGNPGKRTISTAEPKPKSEKPTCPAQLDDEAKREWKRVIRELAAARLISKLDRAALAAYCQSWSRWIEAESMIRKHGVVVNSPTGWPIQSPYLAIANRAMAQMTTFLCEFGLSPAARTRIQVRADESESFDDFVKERGARAG